MYTSLVELYRNVTGHDPVKIIPITGSGSNRRYVRLLGTPSLIGVIGTSSKENSAFIYESDFFSSRGLSVPRVMAVSANKMAYLQEDLGNESLYDIIHSEGFTSRVEELCHKSLQFLAEMQTSANGFNWAVCYPVSKLDRRSVMWDMNYFKYCFLKPSGIEFDEDALENDFLKLTSKIVEAKPIGFMFRDFQSRNILIKNEEPWFIDFQGGRLGPLIYDAVSFLWQARARFSEENKRLLLEFYIEELAKRNISINSEINVFVVFRMLQVLGAYGFRGRIERKSTFLRNIPTALVSCKEYLNAQEYPELYACISKAVEQNISNRNYENTNLIVSVSSFSYKRGIPEDTSGNGGGFVFDCRAIHNPGRYNTYKSLTGEDAPVIEFLESQSNIESFLEHCYALVDASVEKYMKRGFNSLAVNFGCTGGQHRSVYAATHMARHLSEKYGVKVVLNHREQNICHIFERRDI